MSDQNLDSVMEELLDIAMRGARVFVSGRGPKLPLAADDAHVEGRATLFQVGLFPSNCVCLLDRDAIQRMGSELDVGFTASVLVHLDLNIVADVARVLAPTARSAASDQTMLVRRVMQDLEAQGVAFSLLPSLVESQKRFNERKEERELLARWLVGKSAKAPAEVVRRLEEWDSIQSGAVKMGDLLTISPYLLILKAAMLNAAGGKTEHEMRLELTEFARNEMGFLPAFQLAVVFGLFNSQENFYFKGLEQIGSKSFGLDEALARARNVAADIVHVQSMELSVFEGEADLTFPLLLTFDKGLAYIAKKFPLIALIKYPHTLPQGFRRYDDSIREVLEQFSGGNQIWGASPQDRILHIRSAVERQLDDMLRGV